MGNPGCWCRWEMCMECGLLDTIYFLSPPHSSVTVLKLSGVAKLACQQAPRILLSPLTRARITSPCHHLWTFPWFLSTELGSLCSQKLLHWFWRQSCYVAKADFELISSLFSLPCACVYCHTPQERETRYRLFSLLGTRSTEVLR